MSEFERWLMDGLPTPSDDCESCTKYRTEILRLRKMVATPLTMLSGALEYCKHGMLGPAIDMIETWIKQNDSEGEDDEER